MFERYVHEIISTSTGLVLIDVVNTDYIGWEGAYARFDEKIFKEWWEQNQEEPYTVADIIELGEEAGAFDEWNVVSANHRKPEVALRNVMKALKSCIIEKEHNSQTYISILQNFDIYN